MTEKQPRALVGTSGWDKEQWRGHFYRQGLPQRRQLEYASAHLATLEINTTFHLGSSPQNFVRWREGTPDDFIFSVKGSKTVTHDNALRNAAHTVAEFLAQGILELGDKLGPVLWQTSEYLAFQPAVVEEFLAVLPRSVHEAQQLIAQRVPDVPIPEVADRPIRHAFEVRHNSFDTPVFIELLRRYDVAAVVTNTPTWPHFRDVTADFVYLRLHGSLTHYPNGYDEATLREWAELVEGWRSGAACPDNRGRDAFIYFDNPDNKGIRSPFDAMDLQDLLGGMPGRARPETLTQPSLW